MTQIECKVVSAALDWCKRHDADDVEGFEAGAKWATETMIERACKWLNQNTVEYYEEVHESGHVVYDIDVKQLFEDFKKAMEE